MRHPAVDRPISRARSGLTNPNQIHPWLPETHPAVPAPRFRSPFTFEELVAFCGILLIFWIVGKCVERLGLPAVRLPPAHRSPPLYTENISARAPVILRSARADRSSNRRTPTN